MLASTTLVIATARPSFDVPFRRNQTSIILTLDVSRSMCSTDVAPNRLSAAEQAASDLVTHQRGGAHVGIVAFSGVAQIVVPPTSNTRRLLRAIRNLRTGGGTAIGSGILTAIDAISRVDPDVAASTVEVGSSGTSKRGQYVPDIVVLLTDGASNRGVDPTVAAGQAADRGVRVYAVGFGTENPGTQGCTADQLGSDPFGRGFGGGFGGGGFAGGGFGGGAAANRFLSSDYEALQRIATATGAKSYRAESADQLLDVFRKLPSHLKSQTHEREVSVAFVGVGAILALLAFALSMRWNRYP